MGLCQNEAGLMLSPQIQALEYVPGAPTSVPSSVPNSHEQDSNTPINLQINKITLFTQQANHNHFLQFLSISDILGLILTSTYSLHSVTKVEHSKYPLLNNFYIK